MSTQTNHPGTKKLINTEYFGNVIRTYIPYEQLPEEYKTPENIELIKSFIEKSKQSNSSKELTFFYNIEQIKEGGEVLRIHSSKVDDIPLTIFVNFETPYTNTSSSEMSEKEELELNTRRAFESAKSEKQSVERKQIIKDFNIYLNELDFVIQAQIIDLLTNFAGNNDALRIKFMKYYINKQRANSGLDSSPPLTPSSLSRIEAVGGFKKTKKTKKNKTKENKIKQNKTKQNKTQRTKK